MTLLIAGLSLPVFAQTKYTISGTITNGNGATVKLSGAATATVTAVGRRSRQLAFEARVVCRADPARGESAATVLSEPVIVVTATGTVVVPPPAQ